MPEVKNNFIKGKMNKDLDERLLSDGEYRDARNLSTSSSDTGNAGSLENVLGNLELTDFDLTDRGLEIVGYQTDAATDRIFVFLTNYNDSSSDALSNFAPSTSSHYIAAYSVRSKSYSILVQGSFLNFSKTHPVLSVNILEDLLFWNDNRNQPRKINIQTALSKSSSIATDPHYYLEEQISVAKYYPYNPMRLFKKDANSGLNVYNANFVPNITTAPTGTDANTYVLHSQPGTGGGLSISPTPAAAVFLELEIIVASGDVITSIKPTLSTRAVTGGNLISGGIGLSVGDVISTGTGMLSAGAGSTVMSITVTEGMLNQVSTMYDASSENLPISLDFDSIAATVQTYVDVTYGGSLDLLLYIGSLLYIKDANGDYKDNGSQILKQSSGIFVTLIEVGVGAGTHRIHLARRPSNLTIPTNITSIAGDIITIAANPYYDEVNGSNSEMLSDKFARFSYRFRFEDDEYSLIAPFTQPAFIPKQDGFFMTSDGIDSDEQSAIKSTIVEFMENKVNQIEFQIDLPEGVTEAKDLETVLKVKEVEILMKESDSPALKVIDSIKPEDLSQSDDNKIQYLFSSSSAVKTLPESDITRVYDKVPVRALSQEIIGNRVIYGNYLPWYLAPDDLDYSISVGEKNNQGAGIDFFSKREYPNHTLKQNRTYQVGIVLADKFGRQSDVILSDDSTIYSPYRSIDLPVMSTGDIYAGDSLKVVFENPIPSTYFREGYAGLYDADTNPLGWYSYKVVVKQQEQSYYNVYVPTVLNDYPKNTGTKSADTAHITLLGDNINKVPRDLSEVSQLDKVFRSSQELFPRVITPDQLANTSHDAEFYNNFNKADTVVGIGGRDDLGLDSTSITAQTTSPFYSIPSIIVAEEGSNPLIGRMSTNRELGSLGGKTTTTAISELSFDNVSLNIFETKPTYSNLEIYWETTTSGLISELNDTINSDTAIETYAVNVTDLGYKLTESSAINDVITDTFYALDYLANQITTGVVIVIESVKNVYGADFSDRFNLIDNTLGAYSIENLSPLWLYKDDNSLENNLTFTFRVTVGGATNLISKPNNMLGNSYPYCDQAGDTVATISEGSSHSTASSYSGWAGNDLILLEFSNGSIFSLQGEQLVLEVLNLEFYHTYASAWASYSSVFKTTSFQSVPNSLETFAKLRSSGYGTSYLSISRYVRALKPSNKQPWYKVDYDSYPDISSAETTSFRAQVKVSDANGNGLDSVFYILFSLSPH